MVLAREYKKGEQLISVLLNGEKCAKFIFIFRKKFYLSLKYAVLNYPISPSAKRLAKILLHNNPKIYSILKTMEIKFANTDSEIASCWESMFLLRPMLKEEEFLSLIRTLNNEGYHLLYISENNITVAVAGYRIFTMLYCGKILYIDDLSTLESCRGKGYASQLLNHIYEIAKKENCISIQLDSGSTRTIAHKLYFKENFTISAFHFNKIV